MGLFESASEVENLVWTLQLADYPRSENRALINSLMNGQAPWSRAQAEQLNLSVNVNFLEGTTFAHDARRQFSSAFQKPGNFFNVKLDCGPIHKRGEWSAIITKEINKPLKRSLPYFEGLRSTWANVVLHGIGPSVWYDCERWCPRAKSVDDLLVPSNTLVSLENLWMFGVRESYTPLELKRMTSGPNVDKGWNMELVEICLKKTEEEVLTFGIPYKDILSPERQVERIKENSGLYAADSLSTIDTISFFFWDDSKKKAGWRKRIVLQPNYQIGTGGSAGYSGDVVGKLKSKFETRDNFLYNSGERVYGVNHSELAHFQFADLSAVGPFRYHSVRSLGYLLYAVCNIQNRLRCKFLDSTFEQLQQYYRVTNKDDIQRALMIDLVDKGFIDESVKFVPPSERWQINQQLAEMAMEHNNSIIRQSAAIYRENQNYGTSGPEKTATQVMAEVNSATALVSAGLQQAYNYQGFQYREIGRRFCVKNSKDADVRAFRVSCLNQGVPEEYISDVTRWEIEPEKVVGGGNRVMEMAIGDKLMSMFQLFSPEAQRLILRQVTLWTTEDARWSQELVPDDQSRVSNSVHDAQVMMGSLMVGLPVPPTPEQNYVEVARTLLGEAGIIVQRIQAMKRGMPSMDEFMGLQNVAKHIGIYVQLIGRDKTAAPIAKELSQGLSVLQNELKAYQQRLMEQAKAKAGQNGDGGIDPETVSKIKADQVTAAAKAQNARESHAERTAQRHVQFELSAKREAEKHEQDLRFQSAEHAQELAAQAAKDQLEIEKQKQLKSKPEPQ